MKILKKSFAALVLLSLSICSTPLTSQQEQQSWFSRSTQSMYDHRSEIVDATLALSAVWLAVGAVGAYRLSSVTETAVPKWLHGVLDWVKFFSLEERVQLELSSIGCAGGSLSALSLLLLKKLSWEKNTSNTSNQT